MKFQKPYCESSNVLNDNFETLKLFKCIALLAVINLHEDRTLTNYIWSFSIWLEAAAIGPQIYMLIQNQEIENLTFLYVVVLGLCSDFFILNLIYRWIFERYVNLSLIFAGNFQAGLLGFFVFWYLKRPHQKIEKIESNIEKKQQ